MYFICNADKLLTSARCVGGEKNGILSLLLTTVMDTVVVPVSAGVPIINNK